MRRALSLWLLASLAIGCDVYHPDAFDADAGGMDAGPARVDAGRPDAGAPDAGAPDAGGLDAGPACVLRHPPPRPAEADTGDQVLQWALRDVVLAQDGMVWADIGFDHDDECTERVEQGTCASRTGVPEIDGPGGVDNNGGRQVLAALLELDPDLEVSARADQRAGVMVVFLRVEGYNGLDDDPRVMAWIAQSLSAVPEGGMSGDPLRWDGRDQFTLSDADFESGDPTRPLVFDDVAYVANRQLVMQIPDGRTLLIPTDDNPITMRLTDAFMTGTISADGTRLENATLSGRWAQIDIQTVFTQLGICPGTRERQNVDTLLNRFADIRSDPSTDGLGASCDAYSIAIGLTGYAALFSAVGPAPPLVDVCP